MNRETGATDAEIVMRSMFTHLWQSDDEIDWPAVDSIVYRSYTILADVIVTALAEKGRLVQSSPNRAELVELVAEVIRHSDVNPCYFYGECESLAEAALAAVEAAGGWPPIEMTELKPFVGKDVSGE